MTTTEEDVKVKAKDKLVLAFGTTRKVQGILEDGCEAQETMATKAADKNHHDEPAKNEVRRTSVDDLEDVDPVTLAELGTRRGSRFSADGTPLSLRAFLESANPSLNFHFNMRGGNHFIPLEEEYERRIIGKKTRYEMFEGDFRLPDAYKEPTMPEGNRFRISDLYHLQMDEDAVLNVGIMPGWRVPFIMDGNPHQEGLIDHRRAFYLPYSEDKNVIMQLPTMHNGAFFTSQIISGGELIVAFDKTMHRYWILTVNQVYTPSKYARNHDWNLPTFNPDPEEFDESSWRRAIENQAYCDRALGLMSRFGHNLEVIIRVVPTSRFFSLLSQEDKDGQKHPSQARLDNYFRDEIITSKGRIRHYYYEKEAMVYAFHEGNVWKFGLKDRGRNNGYAIKMESLEALYVSIDMAKFPL